MPVTNSTSILNPGRQNESRAYQLTTAAIVCPTFAAALVALRIYTRLVLIRKRFWEDFTIVVALAWTIALSVCMYLSTVYGTGRHVETITPSEVVDGIKVGIAVTQLYSLTHFFLKLSILLQYVRISVMPSDRRLCYVLIAILCTGYLVFIVLRMARCVPFQAQWDPDIPGAKCFFSSTWFGFPSQAWNMAWDLVILLLPLFILRHLKNAPLLHRVLIGVVLAFGGSACIVSVFRLQTLYPSAVSLDPSWDRIPSAIYGLIEVDVGISCASVVTLRPLLHRLRQRFSNGRSEPPRRTAGEYRHPVRFDASTDRVLMTGDTTQVGSENQDDVELGGAVGDHSCVSVGKSKAAGMDVDGTKAQEASVSVKQGENS
ncbi:hypothetical protein B0H67DRAFT_509719 [Lasiosphaeris hirsuta]|uniref:Rhodopsin domain-containing protein n=1 Tax=Lasiosphaeris hirsuta TaxID=260670 RepID=A0AA40DWY6_9PEZI|nr:hypothetical protein B0H67DRAFT_509719 [Lasiosphaeris hirsuta]